VSEALLALLRARTSVERFDSAHSLDEREIRELVADATLAPSSFNIQHWRFVAIRKPEDKARLREAAFGQIQVVEAAVTFVVLGDTQGTDKLPAILERAAREGTLPEPKAAAWLRMAQTLYAEPGMAREEAQRSACLAAMMLMLAAQARGLGSIALAGFDAERVRREFEIDARYLPVLLVAVGRAASVHPTRQPRLPVEEVLAFDRGTF
jgi:nitroreductase